MLSRMDQFRSVPTSHQPPSALWQEFRVGIVLAIVVAIAVPYLASAYWLKTFTELNHHCAVQPASRFMPNWVWCRSANTHCSASVAGLPCGFITDFIFRLRSTFS